MASTGRRRELSLAAQHAIDAAGSGHPRDPSAARRPGQSRHRAGPLSSSSSSSDLSGLFAPPLLAAATSPAVATPEASTLLPSGTHAVAVCFVGQFPWHHRGPTRPAASIFRTPHGLSGAVGTSRRPLVLDAFVTISTQHEEFDPRDLVDGRSLCRGLEATPSRNAVPGQVGGGFRRREHELVKYNVSVFASAPVLNCARCSPTPPRQQL
jgi:hypothetical protein